MSNTTSELETRLLEGSLTDESGPILGAAREASNGRKDASLEYLII